MLVRRGQLPSDRLCPALIKHSNVAAQGIFGLKYREPKLRSYFALYTWMSRRQDRLDPVRDVTDERITGGEVQDDEAAFERSLRPQLLSEFVGQEKVKANLAVFVKGESAMTISWPPTRLASIVWTSPSARWLTG